MIAVNRSIQIPEREVQLRFIRAAGPGGQNVNKVASAVELRFDVKHSLALPEEVRQRLIRQSGKKLNSAGVLIIQARRYRSQDRNRQDALERLVRLVRQAAVKPRARRPTRPSRASRESRLEVKRHRSRAKQRRSRVEPGAE
ncbi:MAG TPA: alternative ribosome rescue aminoacyl-tRNA hydrolase ArfB [Anaerolineales bacterium]|nr:alternative ribosome rescue aminoacyl-tRNA hydrolase ArfB [Anaerolineales bacterium]